MKKIIFAFILISSYSYAQVAIGKNNVTNNSVSLEFADGPKGIILPYVESKAGITTPGTLILDTTDNRVKMKVDGADWFDYSSDSSDVSHNGIVDLSLQTALIESPEAKVSIGDPTDVDGVLVLEDSDKAMILPQIVSPELNVVNPAPGTIVYDPFRKMLCVYNGKHWSYWEAAAN
ncbi:MAG: hypothetical protein Q4F57_05375 [Weeksellaceae bacterium]|nr:hypothetical protein [Weeksellaceae bacterium]